MSEHCHVDALEKIATAEERRLRGSAGAHLWHAALFLLTEAVVGVTGLFGGAERREQIRASIYSGG